jgi:hypothetical protein
MEYNSTRVIATLSIPQYGAMAINKTLDLIKAAYPETKTVEFTFDSVEGLTISAGRISTHIEKAAFKEFIFEESCEPEELAALGVMDGSIVYAMNQELRHLVNQFKIAALRDSLRIQLLQSADSYAPDVIRFVINNSREFNNPTTQVDQISPMYPNDPITLVRDLDTAKLNAVYASFRENHMRRVSIATRTNPHNNRPALAIQVADGAALTNVYYIDDVNVAEPTEFAVELKSLNLLKMLSIMSSSARLDVDNEGEDARDFIIVGDLPKGYRLNKKPALPKIGEVTIRIPCLRD